MTDVTLLPGERIDDLERNGYRIIQNKEKFCFGMDAVLLSGFTVVKKGERVIDLGTGTGIIPILLCAKTEGAHFTGVEIQPEMADMARRSVLLNGIEEKVDILEADLRTFSGACDVVTSNPPYMKMQHGLQNPDDAKAVSRHEICCSLEDVCGTASGLLRTGGRFYMVHRPLRLPEIITELKKVRLEPKRMRFVHPFAGKEANMVLIEAIKEAGPECRVEKPLIIYTEPGKYAEEIYTIYGY